MRMSSVLGVAGIVLAAGVMGGTQAQVAHVPYTYLHVQVGTGLSGSVPNASLLQVALDQLDAEGWELVDRDTLMDYNGYPKYDLVLRKPRAYSTSAPPPPSTTSCPSPAPGAGWTCLNGGWVPPGYPRT